MELEEKQKLIRQAAIILLKSRMKESYIECKALWPKIIKLRKELVALEEKHKGYKKKYEDADRKLAEVDRVKKVVIQKGFKPKGNLGQFSKEQLLELAEELKGDE